MGEPLPLDSEDVMELCDISVAEEVRAVRLQFVLLPGPAVVSPFTNLIVLQLPNCEIEEVLTLPPLPGLRMLDFSFNAISELPEGPGADEFWAGFPSLQLLFLHANAIADWRGLQPLAGLEELVMLTAFGNPVSLLPQYRLFAVNLLPRLRACDHHFVASEERIQGADFTGTRYASLTPRMRLQLPSDAPPTADPADVLAVLEKKIRYLENGWRSVSPVVTVQRWVRGWRGRLQAKHQWLRLYFAAVRIQAIAKGVRQRRTVRRQLEELFNQLCEDNVILSEEKIEYRRAAGKIQAAWRLHDSRKYMDTAVREKVRSYALHWREFATLRSAFRRQGAASCGMLFRSTTPVVRAVVRRTLDIARFSDRKEVERRMLGDSALWVVRRDEGQKLLLRRDRTGCALAPCTLLADAGGLRRRQCGVSSLSSPPTVVEANQADGAEANQADGAEAGTKPETEAGGGREYLLLFQPRSSWVMTVFTLLCRSADASLAPLLLSLPEAERMAAATSIQSAWRAHHARSLVQPPLSERLSTRRASIALQRAWRSRHFWTRLTQIQFIQQLAGSIVSRTVFIEMGVFRQLAEVKPVEDDVLQGAIVPSHRLRFGYEDEKALYQVVDPVHFAGPEPPKSPGLIEPLPAAQSPPEAGGGGEGGEGKGEGAAEAAEGVVEDEGEEEDERRPRAVPGQLRVHIPSWVEWAPPVLTPEQSAALGTVNSLLVKDSNVWRASSDILEDVAEENGHAHVGGHLLQKEDLDPEEFQLHGTHLFHSARSQALMTALPDGMNWDEAGQWLLAVRFKDVTEARRRVAMLALRTWDLWRRSCAQVLSAAVLSAAWHKRQHSRPAPRCWSRLNSSLPSDWSSELLKWSYGLLPPPAPKPVEEEAPEEQEEELEQELEQEQEEEQRRDPELQARRRESLLAKPVVGRRHSVVTSTAEANEGEGEGEGEGGGKAEQRRRSAAAAIATAPVPSPSSDPPDPSNPPPLMAGTESETESSRASSVMSVALDAAQDAIPIPSFVVPPLPEAPEPQFTGDIAVASLLAGAEEDGNVTTAEILSQEVDTAPLRLNQGLLRVRKAAPPPPKASVRQHQQEHVSRMAELGRRERSVAEERIRQNRSAATAELVALRKAVQKGKRPIAASFSLDAAMLRRLFLRHLAGPSPSPPREEAGEEEAADGRVEEATRRGERALQRRQKKAQTASREALVTAQLRERERWRKLEEKATAERLAEKERNRSQLKLATLTRRDNVRKRVDEERGMRDSRAAHRAFAHNFGLQQALITRSQANAKVEQVREAQHSQIRETVSRRREKRQQTANSVLKGQQEAFLVRREEAIAQQLGMRAQLQWRAAADTMATERVAKKRTADFTSKEALRKIREDALRDVMGGAPPRSGSRASSPKRPSNPPSRSSTGPLASRLRGRKFSDGAPPRQRMAGFSGNTARPASPEQIKIQNEVLASLADEARREMEAALHLGLETPSVASSASSLPATTASSSASSLAPAELAAPEPTEAGFLASEGALSSAKGLLGAVAAEHRPSPPPDAPPPGMPLLSVTAPAVAEERLQLNSSNSLSQWPVESMEAPSLTAHPL